jgi:predicted PurR-regulated permease PerM
MSDPTRLAAAPPPKVLPADTPTLSALFGLAVGVVVVGSLYLGRTVLIPITLAALLSFVLAPLVQLLRRIRLGRVPSVLAAVLAAVAVLVTLGAVIGMQIASLADDIPQYRTTIEHKVGTMEGYVERGMASLLRSYARGLQGVSASSPTPPPTDPVTGQRTIKPLPVQVQDATPSPFVLAERVLSPVLGPIATVGIIFLVAVFLLLQQEDLRDRMIRLFGSGDLHRTTVAIDDAAHRLSRYFLTQLGINAAFGLVIGGGLALIGVPSPALWGVIAMLMRFVPYVGSFISAALPVALAAAVDPGWSKMIYTAALFLTAETVVGQAVEPLLYGSSTGLSPFAIIVAAIFWSWLWGPIGLILSTPITLCLVVLGRHVDRLEFLDVLLGDRPALSPIESFYQRMLANDPDEAQAHAEALLRDRALSSYYDEVALKGLLLAAYDADRGVLGPDRLKLIGGAMDGLIEELDAYDDAEPDETDRREAAAEETLSERRLPRQRAPEPSRPEEWADEWREGTPVLCIAGRGPLDETAARMLAQLLGKHGIGARVAPYEAANRANIGTLDLAGVVMVCITYLSVSGAPPHLRYMMGRLRRRLPGARLVVGMWAEGEPTLGDRAVIGADAYVQSLRDAVQACVDAAEARPGALPPSSQAWDPAGDRGPQTPLPGVHRLHSVNSS